MVAGSVTGEEQPGSSGPVELTLIIPAYNEEARLPATLERILAYLSELDLSWELLVADDGSEDNTPGIVQDVEARQPGVRLLRLPHLGKASAIRAGVMAARGRIIVFTDADLSTPIHYVSDVRRLLHSDWDFVAGSREAAGAVRIGEPTYRHIMGRLYNYLVQSIAVPGVRDTQCGFKAFRAEVARDLFGRLLLYRDQDRPVKGPRVTGFDVELFFLARKSGYRIYELPVTWRHVDGSKVRPGIDSFLMVVDALSVRWNELRGRYDRPPLADRVKRSDIIGG